MSASQDKSEQALEPDQSFAEPYFTAAGTLVIPFNSDPKYHWWNKGQKVEKTIEVLRQPKVQRIADGG